jgi:hypothetical protein
VIRRGSMLHFSFSGFADQLTLRQETGTTYRIEQVSFADGTLWNVEALEERAVVEELPPIDSTPPDDPVGEQDPSGDGDAYGASDDLLADAGGPPGPRTGFPVPPPFAGNDLLLPPGRGSALPLNSFEAPRGALPHAVPPVGIASLFRQGKDKQRGKSAEPLSDLVEEWFEREGSEVPFSGFGSPVLRDLPGGVAREPTTQMHVAASEMAASWRRTAALLEAHLVSSETEVLGIDDGVSILPAHDALGFSGAAVMGKLPDIAGHPLRRLEGLREGISVLTV